MTTYQFMLRLAQAPVDEQVRRLFLRADDLCVEVGAWRGWAAVAVDRRGTSLADAIVSVIRDLEAVGLVPADCGPDHDLLPLRSVAEKAGCSSRAVRRWARGESGPGDFPVRVGPAERRCYYRWGDVAQWFQQRLGLRLPVEEATYTTVTMVLRLRVLAPRVEAIETIWSLL